MKSIHRSIHFVRRGAGFIAIGVGSVVAGICVCVIVTTHGGPGVEPVEVIRLDPVVVTISKDRYEEIRAEESGETAIVRSRTGEPGDG